MTNTKLRIHDIICGVHGVLRRFFKLTVGTKNSWSLLRLFSKKIPTLSFLRWLKANSRAAAASIFGGSRQGTSDSRPPYGSGPQSEKNTGAPKLHDLHAALLSLPSPPCLRFCACPADKLIESQNAAGAVGFSGSSHENAGCQNDVAMLRRG